MSLSKQLQEYMAMRPSQQVKHKVTKGSLMLLAPFAASTVLPTVMQGQVSCGAYPNGSATSVFTYNSCPDIYIDIDGDGSADFNIYVGSVAGGALPFIAGINGTILGNVVSGYAYAGNASGTFSAGDFPSSFAAATITYTAFGGGNYGVPSAGFIPIVFNGNLGWIEITIDAAACVTIGSFGVESADGGTDGVGTTVAGDCATLPVELSDLSIKAKGSTLVLSWRTESEINNQGFEIQRSIDGKKFKKVDFVAGSGTSSAVSEYSFTDNKVRKNQMYYYRLKQVDFDGRFDLTKIVSEKVVSQQAVEVYDIFPNPTSISAQLNLSINDEQQVQVHVYDQMGKMVNSQKHTLLGGNHSLNLDISNMRAGIYYVKTLVNGETFYRKLVIE